MAAWHRKLSNNPRAVGNTVTVDWSKVALAASPPLRTLAVSTRLPGLFVFLAALWWEPPTPPGWFTLTYRSAHGCWIGSKQIERGLKAHSGRIEQRIKIGDRWKKIEKQHLRNMTRSTGQRDLACRGKWTGGEGLKNVGILSPIHQLRRSQKVTWAASANWSQIWSERGGKPGYGGIAQVRISIHVQGSAGSVTFSTMMKIHWCGWARISGTSSAVVTGRCRTNKIKSKLCCISGSFDTPVNIESALIDFLPLLEPDWGRNWSLLDTFVISASVHMFHCVFLS